MAITTMKVLLINFLLFSSNWVPVRRGMRWKRGLHQRQVWEPLQVRGVRDVRGPVPQGAVPLSARIRRRPHSWMHLYVYCVNVYSSTNSSPGTMASDWRFYFPSVPTNPCDPNPCGVYALCEVDHGNAVCFCPKGMTGNPFKNCGKEIIGPAK